MTTLNMPSAWGQSREPWNKGLSKYASEEEKQAAERARNREWKRTHRDEINARARAKRHAKWDDVHPYVECPICSAVFRRWCKNQKFCSKRCRKKDQRTRHRDQIIERMRKYNAEHRDEINAKNHERYWRDVEMSRKCARVNYRKRKELEQVDAI